ncbi:MAG TPA: tRNA pseudouridine(55) synthase TruB [Solirubrobacteraceae bacterium]|jgi:tRNA pseudouridine55 synthase|nr:tRNA pseudouridine(55) synthase TruB [Solirubrobacteraceae bacterium]
MDGVILVDKPAGRTSHDVVAAVRRELGGRGGPKVGHAGTLDPFATGLLLVLVGRATRVQRFFMALPKTYEAVARFGAVSTTGDVEGEITETGAPIPEPLVLPAGELRQRPPAHSAVKVGGERAYRLARRGEEVELPERTVTVYEAEELWRDPPRVALRLRCSAGTYVRSYVADLGDAYCEQLCRTAIGPFSVNVKGSDPLSGPHSDLARPAGREGSGREGSGGEGSDPLSGAHSDFVRPAGREGSDPLSRVGGEGSDPFMPLEEALAAVMPVVRLEGEAARRAGHGVVVEGVAGGPVLLAGEDGPIAVAEPREGGLLKPTVGFRG